MLRYVYIAGLLLGSSLLLAQPVHKANIKKVQVQPLGNAQIVYGD